MHVNQLRDSDSHRRRTISRRPGAASRRGIYFDFQISVFDFQDTHHGNRNLDRYHSNRP